MGMNEDLDLRKAFLDTTVGTTGSKLIPEVVSEGLRQFVVAASPLYAITPKQAWSTNAYIYREVSALPTATFLDDGATMTAATVGTYGKKTVAMKYIYTRGEVTGPLQAAAGGVVDALAEEIQLHAKALVRQIEQKIVTGDSTTPQEFDGLDKQIVTQAYDAATSALSLTHMDAALDKPLEYPTHIIANRTQGRKLWALLQAQQRFMDRTEVAAGFRVPVYNDLPIIRVDNAITGLSAKILMPDMRWVKFLINQDVTFEPLAHVKDSDDFMLKMYCTLAVEGEALFHTKIINLT